MQALQAKHYDPNVVSCEELAYYSYETLKEKYPQETFSKGQRSVAILRYDIQFPFPFNTKRSLLSAVSSYYDKDEEKLVMIYKPCEHPDYYMNGKNVNKGKHLLDVRDFQIYQFKKLDSHRTSICQLHLLDVGGFARPAIRLLRYVTYS